ncbi:uncharacterized protein N7484_002172 [Penicillium longicatenatum]|uniref:uncharacterized protein n=1 Tax=Penicillium longicatenatum TaxID=1561947 RepID=UPI002546FB72|nr:uncharacterized protein N7484_002172 [Penicillium longicatenatum]KAJ5658523.1 hypothetical protein N7484_002172 [Penicillium longicatenatum]
MTEAEFEAWNPIVTELGSGCTLIADLYYCVQIDYETISVTVASTSTSKSVSTAIASTVSTTLVTATPTSSGDGISTPTPYQTGIAANCDEFYLVVSGDECGTIATDEGISLEDFYAWNPAVGTSCAYLDLGDYVCVGTIGSTATATPTTSPATTGDGVTTPTPYQTGMVSDCDLFHLVVSGDGCYDIAAAAGIALNDFYTWNPAVGTSCAYLDLGDYVCIGIIDSTATATTTSSSATTGDGVTTPTPYQTGMVSDCDLFHLVVSGDGCYDIAAAAGIALDDFYTWNPAVGTSCAYLYLGDYVCIGIL